METTRNAEITEENIGLWHKCAQCNEVSFRGELERNGFICPKCKELFPLSNENRLKLLMGDDSSDTSDVLIDDNVDSTSDVFAAEENIAGYPISLFILDPESSLLQQHLTVFSEAVTCALKKSIPLLSVFTANPIEVQISFSEIVPLLLQLEQLAQETLPHLTILTETRTGQLTSHLPVGEIVIAECVSRSENTPRFHPQPALHAPEEQLLPEKNRELNPNLPDISVDCYIPRPELHTVLTRLLKFFASSPTI
jgi:acetyl-CoA carboxylase carboxyl transferase subunit beta